MLRDMLSLLPFGRNYHSPTLFSTVHVYWHEFPFSTCLSLIPFVLSRTFLPPDTSSHPSSSPPLFPIFSIIFLLFRLLHLCFLPAVPPLSCFDIFSSFPPPTYRPALHFFQNLSSVGGTNGPTEGENKILVIIGQNIIYRSSCYTTYSSFSPVPLLSCSHIFFFPLPSRSDQLQP